MTRAILRIMPRHTSHPGVTLVQRPRAQGVTWYGRVRSGASCREVNLTALGLTTPRQRLLWAERTSAELRQRARDEALGLRTGPPPVPPREAGERFLRDAEVRLRPRTICAYRASVADLVAWLERAALSLERLDPPQLWRWREHVLRARTHQAPTTRANTLRRSGVVISWWRRAGLVPRLTRDEISDILTPPPQPRPLPVCLTPEQIAAVLAAAVRCGAPAAALTALALLTGMRVGELCALRWDEVTAEGVMVGIGNKTHRARCVALDVSPMAYAILQAMPRTAARVFPRFSVAGLGRLAARIRRHPGVPPRWTWHHCRETCATYLVCAPVIYGGASAYLAARRLGHSVAVAERHYLGLVRVDASATTLEAAWGPAVRAELLRVIALCRATPSAPARRTPPTR